MLTSERISVLQPSISTAFLQTESELDFQLFLRCPAQGLSLTPADQELLAGLERAEFDMIMSYDPLIPEGFHFTQLAERSAVTLAEMAQDRFILLDRPLSRDFILELFAADGLTPRVGAQI